MTPYAQTKLSQENHQIFRKVEAVVHNLPDIDLGTFGEKKKPVLMSCHILARAVGGCFGLKVVDGEYIVGFSHSWLLTPDGRWVIDVYPCATVGGPIIVDASAAFLPGKILYKEGKVKAKLLPFTSPEFKNAVRLTRHALKEGLYKNEIKKLLMDLI
jgi:hypothetical protein